MKQLLAFLFVLILVVGFSLQAQAELFNRGTDNFGNRLIYDNDLNVTWYDYTETDVNWYTAMDWASNLTVTLGESVFDDWRLPSTVDGPRSYGYDGTTTAGFNVTSSEMGHLFYTELGNKGYCNTSGVCPQTGWGLTIIGDFLHLPSGNYWSGTEYAPSTGGAWGFSTYDGGQDINYKGISTSHYYAIAVRPGDVSVVPEPISSILFLAGGATLIGRKHIRRKKIEV